MSRRNAFTLLLLFHMLIDRVVTRIFGNRFRQQYIQFSYRIKARLFPEYGSYVPTLGAIRSPPQDSVGMPQPIPEWVLSEMRDLGRDIDPVLYPSDAFIASCRYFSVPVIPKPGHIYEQLIQQCTADHYTHCFAIPWLKRGDADLVRLKHIEFANKQPEAKVLVMLTEPGASPWRTRIPVNVDVLDIWKVVSDISHEELFIVISRLLVQLRVDVLHIINSRLVWEVVCKYGLAIRQRTRIFASLYCDDYDKYGQPVGYARQYLGHCYMHLTNVFSDNSTFPGLLCRTYGYPREFFKVVKTPAPMIFKGPQVRPISAGRRVLWAGRLDRQKRPDVLLAVAAALPDVLFTVFGSGSIEAMRSVITKLKKLNNVKMMGAYDGPELLPFASHDIFLYTSQWDGMPNMVLAAVSAGIPVVASCIGGIGDVINEQTGFPVLDIDDASAYVSEIRYALENPSEAKARALIAKEYVERVHTQAMFEISLLNTEGYFSSSTRAATKL